MAKYETGDALEPPDRDPQWIQRTSADIEIDVRVRHDGYQEDRKWTVHCSVVGEYGDGDGPGDLIANFGVEHQNKGNFWRRGELYEDAVDFEDLPLIVRQRVAHILGRDLDAITPEEREVHREDGTGIADREGVADVD